jgi:hypothetical protein
MPPPDPKHLTMAELVERRARIAAWLRPLPADSPQRDIGLFRLAQITDEIKRRGGRLDNPAWLDRVLETTWHDLERRGPPLVTLLASGKLHAKPYGCGVWGCVLPTSSRGTVLKITNDATEAQFVATLLRTPHLQKPGIVRYYDIVKLPVKRERRDVYAIWREEAYDVGHVVSDDIVQGLLRTKEDVELAAFNSDLIEFRTYADRFFDLRHAASWSTVDSIHELAGQAIDLVGINDDGEIEYVRVRNVPLKMAVLLQICRVFAAKLTRGAVGSLVGKALGDLMHDGILLCDVHQDNVGYAQRGKKREIVITDPGYSTALYRALARQMEQAA